VTGFAGRKLNKIKSAANEDATASVPVANIAETKERNPSDSKGNANPQTEESASKRTSSVASPAKKKSIFKKLFNTPTKSREKTSERDAFMSGFSANNPPHN
jgi:hypothetical protein